MKVLKRCQVFFSLSGFTLIELMIAVLMATLIVGALYGSFRAGLDSWEKGQFKSELCQNARIALEQMSREIRGAFISQRNSYYKFVGEDNTYGGNDADILNFFSTSASLNRLCEIGYFIEKDPNNPLAELKRRCDPTPDSEFREGGTIELLAMFVTGLNLRYFDGESWEDSWVTDEDEDLPLEEEERCLPKAVEITISVENPEVQQEPLIFSTIVSIPTSTISSEEKMLP